MRQERGDTTMITGCVLGPLNLACQLIGMEKALYLAVDETDAFTELLDFSTDLCIAYGIAQIEAGVHISLVFDVSASTEIIPAAFFREFEVPRLKKIFSHFKAAGAVANWLFVTGNIEPILPYLPEAGVDIANFDYCVSPEIIKQSLPNTCVNGNIKPLLFEHGDPEGIANTSRKLLNAFSARSGFILAAGCEIPIHAKSENIRAMVDAAVQQERNRDGNNYSCK